MLISLRMTGDTSEALMDGLITMLVGMGIVFGALVLIMVLLQLMQRLLSGGKKVAPLAAGVRPEIIAVISAAVVAIAGTRARIKSIRLVRTTGQFSWAQQGRSRHHQSHRVHRGKR